jgi:hypothetical protein
MLGWDETDWAVFSQSGGLVRIGTRLIDAAPQAWGTDGKTLFPLFATPSATLAKTLQTKYFGGDAAALIKASYAFYLTAAAVPNGPTTLSYSTCTVDAIGQALLTVPSWMADEVPTQGGSYAQTAFSLTLNASAPVTAGIGIAPTVAGSGLGLTLTTTVADYQLLNLQLGYLDVHAIA